MRGIQQKLGKAGEDRAVQYLHQNGYQVLERNWRAGRAEIDIIAQIAETIVFIEVKASRGRRFGNPEDRVNWIKKRQLIKAALCYLYQNPGDLEPRFDVIAIDFLDPISPILHFENAFTAEDFYE